jgi:hypothetical protein
MAVGHLPDNIAYNLQHLKLWLVCRIFSGFKTPGYPVPCRSTRAGQPIVLDSYLEIF